MPKPIACGARAAPSVRNRSESGFRRVGVAALGLKIAGGKVKGKPIASEVENRLR